MPAEDKRCLAIRLLPEQTCRLHMLVSTDMLKEKTSPDSTLSSAVDRAMTWGRTGHQSQHLVDRGGADPGLDAEPSACHNSPAPAALGCSVPASATTPWCRPLSMIN